MKARIWQMAVFSAAVVLAGAVLPADVTAEEAAAPQPQVALEASQEGSTDLQVQSRTDPDLLWPGSCLPSTPLSCADLPSTPNSSCSCTQQLQPVKCKSCDGGKGQVLETTCTISFACTNPPCDIQQNITRTGYSCGG